MQPGLFKNLLRHKLPFLNARGAALLGLMILAGCADKEPPLTERPQHTLYEDGMKNLTTGYYAKAAAAFDAFERQYPYSAWAPKAQVMSAYANYLNRKYPRAIAELENFVALYPNDSLTSYVFFLKALCYYEQITLPDREINDIELALQAFTELQNRFPKSVYAKASIPLARKAYNRLAENLMIIGRFYQNKELFLAALLNFQTAYQTYPKAIGSPEALMRIVETSLALGLWTEAQLASEELADLNPSSPFYHDTWSLLKKIKHPKAKIVLQTLPSPKSVNKEAQKGPSNKTHDAKKA